MTVAGDTFIDPARIASILWVGVTTAGDTVMLRDRNSTLVLWECITDSTSTYLGISFGAHGLPAPTGFRLDQISAGRIYVYLREA